MKKRVTATLLSALFLTGISGFVQAAETTTISAKAVNYADLTDAQKSAVQKGTISFSVEKGIPCVKIVYSNNKTVTVSLLPNTGSIHSTALMALGLGAVGFAGYLVFKNKKNGKTMLVALAGVSSLFVASQVSAANQVIETQEYRVEVVNGVATVTPKAIAGYEYVGYLLEDCHSGEVTTQSTSESATTTVEQSTLETETTTSALSTEESTTQAIESTETTTVAPETTTMTLTTITTTSETTTDTTVPSTEPTTTEATTITGT